MRQLFLLSNQWVNWDETSQKASSQWPHQNSFKFFGIHAEFWFPWQQNIKKLWNSSSPKLVGRFTNNFVEMFLGWPSIWFLQAMLIGRKNMAATGRGYFALYGYSENLKNILLKVWGRFSNNFVEILLGWPSIRFLQAMLIDRKLWPPGDGAYIYGLSEKK